MKKLLLFTLALLMTLSLAACGGEYGESVTMVDVTTEQGIKLKLPSDMTKQSEAAYANMGTGDVVSFGVSEIGGFPLSDWKEETVLTTYSSKYENVVIKSFENGKQINGKEALVSELTLTTPKGNALTMVLVMVTDDKYNYVVSFAYGSEKTDGSLAKNLQTCIDSIRIK